MDPFIFLQHVPYLCSLTDIHSVAITCKAWRQAANDLYEEYWLRRLQTEYCHHWKPPLHQRRELYEALSVDKRYKIFYRYLEPLDPPPLLPLPSIQDMPIKPHAFPLFYGMLGFKKLEEFIPQSVTSSKQLVAILSDILFLDHILKELNIEDSYNHKIWFYVIHYIYDFGLRYPLKSHISKKLLHVFKNRMKIYLYTSRYWFYRHTECIIKAEQIYQWCL
jgi:hypothetical protein